jgi:EAL domain-containing protein (putative c-di-GMP-specific phosphodiesterase class I)
VGARVQAVLDAGGPETVFQPIASLRESRIVAFEALARFPDGTGPGTPDGWFTEAEQVSLRIDLEVAAVRAALTALDWLEPEIRIAVNACPAAVPDPAMVAELLKHDLTRVIVEITEHDQVADYDRLRRTCDRLRQHGAMIAVDDAGSGYAGLQHLIEIRPDIIKLDGGLIRDIDADVSRAALASGLLTFARATDATVLAEGIETAAELSTLTRLGIPLGQGHLLGRPTPLPRTLDLRHVPAQLRRSATG